MGLRATPNRERGHTRLTDAALWEIRQI